MIILKHTKAAICAAMLTVFAVFMCTTWYGHSLNTESTEGPSFIRYAEFNVPYSLLERAMKIDINSHGTDKEISWIDLLAYLAAKCGGNFKKNYSTKELQRVLERVKNGECLLDIGASLKTFNYFHEVYTAVLDGFLGEHKIDTGQKDEAGEVVWEEKYGLKVFSPIAKGFPYHHYEDFGCRRTYGFTRPHQGHDMMAQTGTPVIAVESGTVEAMGWNQYGGWRVGIRSFDKKRYYYYAHLRKDKPFHETLCEGKVVKAGDVIGYVGRTGYSTTENVNNIKESHLHIGMELIFDESQKECDNEIWIDMYAISKLLEKNRSAVVRQNDTKHYSRLQEFWESSLCE